MGISTKRSQSRTVVGIDAAAQPKNIGLARGTNATSNFSIEEVATGSTREEIVEILLDWCDETTLIAIDAPLGWPAAFGESLKDHRAGESFGVEANSMFRRRTDDVIHEVFGKRPLDVGADRIARTAHSALDILDRVRERLGRSIPLAWDPTEADLQAIEVYPAVTLISRGLSERGYKGGKLDAVAARKSLLASLEQEIQIGDSIGQRALASDHLLDAILCVVAGADFLEEMAMAPEDLSLAQSEGWIWTRRPDRGPN